MGWDGRGQKQTWPILKHYPNISSRERKHHRKPWRAKQTVVSEVKYVHSYMNCVSFADSS
jgi:hypothetical protein